MTRMQRRRRIAGRAGECPELRQGRLWVLEWPWVLSSMLVSSSHMVPGALAVVVVLTRVGEVVPAWLDLQPDRNQPSAG